MTNTAETLTKLANRRFDSLEWPGVEDEAWRRTNLERLLPKGFLDQAASVPRPEVGDADSGATPLLPDGYAARIITEGGAPTAMALSPDALRQGLVVEWAEPEDYPAALESAARADLEDADRLAVWHWRDTPGSLVLRVPKGRILDGPVVVEERLIDRGGDDAAVRCPHLHVEASENAEIDVVWSIEGAPERPDVTPLVNAGLSALVGPAARVRLTLRQGLGERVALFLHDHFEVLRDATVVFTESHLGGALVKTRARAVLSAQGADARLNGIFVAGEGRHMDIGTLQRHRAPRATSNALYKGVVRPGGRSVFQGLIEVAPHASGTDAYLTNNNLVLGDGARADSLPQLDILTDDVKCSHGSTTGRLDEAQLFYLRSRGYSPEEARRELIRGFLSEIVDRTPSPVSAILAEDLDASLDAP